MLSINDLKTRVLAFGEHFNRTIAKAAVRDIPWQGTYFLNSARPGHRQEMIYAFPEGAGNFIVLWLQFRSTWARIGIFLYPVNTQVRMQ